MSGRARWRSKVIAALLGDRSLAARRVTAEFKRRITGGAHSVSVFLQLDDPYSYLLSVYLPFIADDYDIECRLYLSQALGEEFRPAPALMAEYAMADCALLSRELGIPFLDKGETPVVEHRRALLRFLVGECNSDDFPAVLCAALSGYWRGDSEGVARMAGWAATQSQRPSVIESNQHKLESLGHYATATMKYAGEWYWGVDRLHHLLDRLDDLNLRMHQRQSPELASVRQAMQLKLPATAPNSAQELPSLEFYFSFRSPYSYLAMQRTFDLADAYRLTLRLRPVLPMVMRGLPVPRAKLAYIGLDAAREARQNDLPFGRICDPLGAGVERCLAVFFYAAQQHRAREFMLAAGAGIWSGGTDVASDEGMREVTERAGLFWPDVLAAMNDNAWQDTVEDNQTALGDAGLWGVPGFRFGDVSLWGQDRLWLLARVIEDRCHDGEGIMI